MTDAGREQRRHRFLAATGWGECLIQPLAADASFRRYYRLDRAGRGAMLMDAPPPMEDVRPFIMVDRLLRGFGYSAPGILAEDIEHGFLLLEDLGDQTYTRLIAAGAEERPLYALAIDLLADLHRRFAGAALPAYSETKLLDEAALLTDWHLDSSASARDDYLDRWRAVLPLARKIPDSLVLRDYHIDNLMLLDQRLGLQACGLLDFQDAVIGPVAYDVVSLLEDARRDVPDTIRQDMVQRYLAAAPEIDPDAFATALAVLGAQRHAKVIGIFRRLDKRDGKPGYLKHLPRLWGLLERSCRHPALAPIAEWLDRNVVAR